MNNPLVSAIIPAFNSESFLESAVRSAVNQAYENVEIIIVDDGSTDSTARLADELAARWPTRVRVIHQPNAGVCAARNAGISEAKGEFLAMLDADDEWLPDHISDAMAVFASDGKVGLVHANNEWIDAAGVVDRVVQGRWPQARAEDPWGAMFLRLEHVNCLTAVLRRSALGGEAAFDMRFNRLGCEDRDLWLRIAARHRVVYLDKVNARYRRHGDNTTRQTERMLKARLVLIDKHAGSGRGRQLARQALAASYVDSADEYRASRQFGQALSKAMRAFWLMPFALRVWKAVAAALLRKG